jgi:hypothetical protein
VLRESDLTFVFQSVFPSDDASGWFSFSDRHFVSGNQLFKCFFKIVTPSLRSLIGVSKSVIDAAAVANVSTPIEHEGFRSPACCEDVRNNLSIVEENRKTNAEFFDVFRDNLRVVRKIRIDRDNLHALIAIPFLKIVQHRNVGIPDRTLSSQENNDNMLRLVEVGKRG